MNNLMYYIFPLTRELLYDFFFLSFYFFGSGGVDWPDNILLMGISKDRKNMISYLLN